MKAYLKKEGTTTIQCARRLKRTCSIRRWNSELRLFHRQPEDVICSSDDCFGRQQSLLQPDHWAEKTASHQWAIETVNKSMGYRQDYQESPPIRMENRNMSAGFLQTPSQSMIATVSARSRQTCFLYPYQQNEVAFCIAITIAIRKATSFCGVNHFPDQTILPSKQNRIRCLLPAIPRLAKAYHQKRRQHRMKCARRLKRTCSSRRWHSSFHVIPPNSPKM